MHHQPVNWTEGIFLQPQHFQATERHVNSAAAISSNWLVPYAYGVQRLEINEEALKSSKFEVNVLEARMPDGTLVVLNSEPDRIDLSSALESNTEILVYLALPRFSASEANVGDAADSSSRFRVSTRSIADDSIGGNEQLIEFRCLNARLKTSADSLEGFDLLPIAKVIRSAEAGAETQLAQNYVPPVLHHKASMLLSRELIRATWDILAGKLAVVSQQVQLRGFNNQPDDIRRVLGLQAIGRAVNGLRVLAFSQQQHPFTVYHELAEIVGSLGFLSQERCVTDIPDYNHDNLYFIFDWMKFKIRSLLDALQDNQLNQRMFEGYCTNDLKPRMQVAFNPEWLGPDWEWFVGVRVRGMQQDQTHSLLERGLHWKLGSGEDVDRLFERKLFGLELAAMSQVPSDLPARDGWLYYRVSKDRSNNAWQGVLQSQSLAIRFNPKLVPDTNSVAGCQELELNLKGTRVSVQFCLFATERDQSD